MTATGYQITVLGALGLATRQAFAGMHIEIEPARTVLSGDLEQAGLHALLERVHALGLELVEVRQYAAPPAAEPDQTAAPRRERPE